jgi:c-di-GMP-binding flagellar brake protein YcgR
MVTVERRKFMRFNTALHGGYELLDGRGSGRSEVKNLSREGIQILIDRELERGTAVGLFVEIPGDTASIYARAEVAWNKQVESGEAGVFATGLKFTRIDRFDRARLLDYVYSQWLKFLKREV